jgi:phosphoribosylformylglycinamidine synthase
VEVRPRDESLDGRARDILADIHQLGLPQVETVRTSRLYLLEGDLVRDDVARLAEQLLADPVAETFRVGVGLEARESVVPSIEVHYRPGVMDPAALSALGACRRALGERGNALAELKTARRYEVFGACADDVLERIAAKVLANDCIETCFIQGLDRWDALPARFLRAPEHAFELRTVRLTGRSDAALAQLSRETHLFLSIEELKAIREHFAGLGRDPTDLELETLAQTWSEHCVHKTLKSAVEYEGEDFGRPGTVRVTFRNLLADTIAHATRTLNRDWCLSVFEDNAGVIAFDEEYGIAFKVETHNHPSAIEPYGGAATGIGGCIRDIMGCGLGAKPIASTDVFCLAPPDFPAERLPREVLHPRRVLKGVVAGVRDYGNRMGIPTVNGAIHFDERYLANPLVFCGSLGLIPRNRIRKGARPGDRIVVAGGRTGRDGIHGATFSSAELTDAHADEFAHAVQIGNAIEEKKLLDALLLARDHAGGCLFSAVTDCGAGGLSSAVGEMGRAIGAAVELERVPLKYAGLRYDEIWISEAQERMVFAVPPERLDTFLGVFAAEEVEATVIGAFTDDHALTVRFQGETVGALDMGFLHEGFPRATRRAVWRAPSPHPRTADAPRGESSETVPPAVLLERLRARLGEWTIASKEWVIRQYDHEVQGRSVIKPLVGPGDGPSDAAVLRPRYDRAGGVALGCGLCPELADVDPYTMAIAAVDEALRNVISVGADPTHTAILDNFCWGKVETPEALGALVRACRGAADAAIAYGLPFISGKDSLNNEFVMDPGEARRLGLPAPIVIPGTLLISAVGRVADVERCVTMDLKRAGHVVVLAAAPFDREGVEQAAALHRRVAQAIASGSVHAAHDVSDGGWLVTLAEMCIAGGIGATVSLDCEAGQRFDPFDRVHTAYLLEMSAADAERFGWAVLAEVDAAPLLSLWRESLEAALPVDELRRAWQTPLGSGVR